MKTALKIIGWLIFFIISLFIIIIYIVHFKEINNWIIEGWEKISEFFKKI